MTWIGVSIVFLVLSEPPCARLELRFLSCLVLRQQGLGPIDVALLAAPGAAPNNTIKDSPSRGCPALHAAGSQDALREFRCYSADE
jgi:hypothetical protein